MARSIHIDTQSLSTFFGSDRAFYTSPLGGMIEHCRSRSRDSSDRPIPRPPPWSFLPQPDAKRGVKGLRGIMYVHETPNPLAGSYEVDASKMASIGHVDRRLRAVCRISTLSYQVLAAYHGDRGALWASAATPRTVENPKTGKPEVIKGVGPGALASLFMMTEAGRALLALERELCAKPTPTRAMGKRQEAALLAHAAYREELQQAIASKQADLDKLIERGGQLERTAADLGTARVEEALAKEAGTRVPTAVRRKIAKAEQERDVVRDGQQDLRRTLHHLRSQLAYGSAAVPTATTKADDGFADTLRERRELLADYQVELAVWLETKESLERVCGPMADTDPRLGPKPPEPSLPAVPQARTVLPRAPWRSEGSPLELSDDARLKNAFVLASTPSGGCSDQNRRNITRRNLLLQRAAAQATALLHRAWLDWHRTDPTSAPPLPALLRDAPPEDLRGTPQARA